MITKIKRNIISHLANIIGWKTKRKIIVFLSDDWGTIRTASKETRDKLISLGLNFSNDRFDYYDALENKDDLIGLYETLSKVKDINGRHAVFTPYAIVGNPNFDKMRKNKFEKFEFETIKETYDKLPGYDGVWDLWEEGMDKKIFMPQFHGTIHMNKKIMMDGLQANNKQMLTCAENQSWAGIENVKDYLGTYSYQSIEENKEHIQDIEFGLDIFQNLFGFRSKCFVPPQSKYHRSIEESIKYFGIDYLDVPRVKHEVQFDNTTTKVVTQLGQSNNYDQKYVVRNVMFENIKPSGIDWVDFALISIDAAFRMNAPAIISSHRVNFVGHIEPQNRDKGLKDLERLLTTSIQKWPNIEFMSLQELVELMK